LHPNQLNLRTNDKIRFLSFAVGNKNDDPDRKVVITEDAQRFANQMDIQLFETSAKDNINVEEMFLAITEQVMRHKKQTQRDRQTEQNETLKLTNTKNKKRKNKCC
jgi:Ras-related protein Rab-35